MPGPMAMEAPPQPPDVAAQKAPFAQVGAQMGQQAAAGNPVKTALDAVSKVMEQIAKTQPKMGPYVQRALAILKAGVEETSKGNGQGPESGPKPPEEGAAPQAGPPPGNMPA